MCTKVKKTTILIKLINYTIYPQSLLSEVPHDVVVDEQDDPVDDESSVGGGAEAAVEDGPAPLPHRLLHTTGHNMTI